MHPSLATATDWPKKLILDSAGPRSQPATLASAGGEPQDEKCGPRLRPPAKAVRTMDEQQLIDQIGNGDAEALAQFIQARRAHLLAYIQRQCSDALRSKIEIEDIFQEMSAEAVRSLDSVDLHERDPFGWLCQVAQRRIIDAHRRYFGAKKRNAGREISIDAPAGGRESRCGLVDLLVASMTTASQAVSRDRRAIKLMEALALLPEDQREAIRLRYVEGLPSKEIAQRLGKTDGAVRVMLTRTLNKLQTLLGPDAAPSS